MSNPHATAQVAGHPIHPMLVPFPIAFFTATLVCDLVYRQTSDNFWFTATQYLLGAGVVMALAAALAGFTDFVGDARIRNLTVAWGHMLGNLLMVLVQAYNWYHRHEMGADAVIPTGLALSLIGVVIMLVTGWLGWEMVYRKRVAIAAEGETVEEHMHGHHTPHLSR
ncbi:MAG TPA: DUF2231 domain-containing protein [Rhizomicrobium sp.]|nr:DUF2231 domain-containing protein [Rhizomicrobium sp.]